MKIIFGEDPGKEKVEYLPQGEGSFYTGSQATITYIFDKEDGSVRLRIEDDWFWEQDLDELIAFLQAAKAVVQE